MPKARLPILILRHPAEKRSAHGTGPLVIEALENAYLATGLSWPNLKVALTKAEAPERLTQIPPSGWGILYFGTGLKESLPRELRDRDHLIHVSQKGNIHPESAGVISGLQGLVVLDSSWRDAKAMWWRNPWMLKLKRLVLIPSQKSAYKAVRRSPKKEQLSTLEAVAQALRTMGDKAEVTDCLLAAFDRKLSESRPLTEPKSDSDPG
jgi:DTW domain-containing protein YfiP